MSSRSERLLQIASAALALALLLTGPVHAQQGTAGVGGTVTDEDGAPLPGVHVLLHDRSGDPVRGTATDPGGRYRIDAVPAGRYLLSATAVGYRRAERNVELAPGDVAEVDFSLEEVTLHADEVVVTAARRAQEASRVPVSISVLSPRALERRAVTSLDEALQYVPGVQLAGNQVSVRGSSGFSFNTGSRVLLLVDGMPMLRPDMEGLAFDVVPPTQIARVEVLKGPGSALYGGGALGGVVHVLTKNFPETPETTVRSYAGVHDPVRYAVWRERWAGAETPRPFGGVALAHARRLGDDLGFWANLSYRADAGYLRRSAGETMQAFTKIGWRPAPALHVDLLTGLTRRTSDTFLYWNGARDALNPGRLSLGRATATGADDHRTHEVSFLPSMRHVLRPDLFYRLKGRLFGIFVQPLDDDLRPKDVQTWGFRYGGEAQLDWQSRAGGYLTAGVSGDANATLSSFFVDDRIRRQPEGAVFAQWEQTLRTRLDVTAGLRLDLYQIRRNDVVRRLSPKLSAAYALSDDLTLRAGYGRGFRVPSVTERYVSDRSYFPIVANVDLRPEESTAYEAGLRFEPSWEVVGLRLDAALFWNDYRRLVEPTFIPREQAFQFVNLTRARIRGLETSLEAALPDDRLELRIGYTLLDADDLTTGLPLAFRSRHLVKAGLEARLPGPLEAGLDYRIASRPERVDSDFALFIPDAETMITARVLDVRAGLAFRQMRLLLLVRNALDYYYLERPALLAPPRRFLLQLQADL